MRSFLTALPESSGLFSAASSPWGLLVVWLIAINLITFFVFGVDKWKAKRKAAHASVRRVPEKTPFLLSILGGSAGALLGMRVWHHKTLHTSFRIGIPLILLAQLLIPAGLWVYWNFCR